MPFEIGADLNEIMVRHVRAVQYGCASVDSQPREAACYCVLAINIVVWLLACFRIIFRKLCNIYIYIHLSTSLSWKGGRSLTCLVISQEFQLVDREN